MPDPVSQNQPNTTVYHASTSETFIMTHALHGLQKELRISVVAGVSAVNIENGFWWLAG